jgi:gluconolactonase
VVRLDPALDQLIPADAKVEVLAGGFEWSEGPVWVDEADGPGYLLFSDIPANSIFKWVEGQGVSLYLKPAGYTGVAEYGIDPGTNGLLLDAQGQLICCEHGDRRISVVTNGGGKRTLVDNYEGKRLNSPNDAVMTSRGDLYFTDPPYGLPRHWEDPLRELDFCGVYRLAKDGTLTLLTKEFPRPNGIGLSPDEKTLYVGNSQLEMPVWKAFPIQEDGNVGPSRVFYDATEEARKLNVRGAPDGLAVDKSGNVFASGLGSVWVFNPQGKPLGRIFIGEAVANCAFGGRDRSQLFITADMSLCRIQTKTVGK